MRIAGAHRLVVAALALSVCLLVVAAAPAFAAQRFASPSGSGTACTSGLPCSVVTAINSAANNDEVIVQPGTYGSPGSPLTTQLAPPAPGITIHGVSGQTRPVIFDDPGGITPASSISQLSTTASYLDIEAGVGGLFVDSSGSGIDQMIVHSTGASGYACHAYIFSTVKNSLCWSSAPSGRGVITETSCSIAFPVTLRNVDAIANGSTGTGLETSAFGSGCAVTITATNVIARGTSQDVTAAGASSGTSTVNLDHSDYANAIAGSGGSITPAGSGSNITSDPAFANPTGGDFHETGSSSRATPRARAHHRRRLS